MLCHEMRLQCKPAVLFLAPVARDTGAALLCTKAWLGNQKIWRSSPAFYPIRTIRSSKQAMITSYAVSGNTSILGFHNFSDDFWTMSVGLFVSPHL